MRNQKNKLQHTAIVIANITMFFVQGPRCSSLAVINPSTASRNLVSVTNPSWETFVPRKSWMITRGSFCSGLARKTRTTTCRRANAPKQGRALSNRRRSTSGARTWRWHRWSAGEVLDQTHKHTWNNKSLAAAAAAAAAVATAGAAVEPGFQGRKLRLVRPKTPDLEALCLDKDSQITMENIVDDTLNLHSASDVRVVDALCLSVAIHTYVYTVHKLSIYTNIWV